MNLSVVIPSKLFSNLVPCLEAVRRNEPNAEPVIVDDGLSERIPGWEYVDGIKPFAFPRAINMGIRRAIERWPEVEAFVIHNDDALLETHCGFSLLLQAANEHPEFGLISATTNVTGNPEQNPRGIGLRVASRNIAFVSVLVPRRTIETVGFMDEQFGGLTPEGRVIYGSCDSDLSRRVRNAGLKIGVHDAVFVDHGSLRSTFRGDPRAAGDCSAGRELYLKKWGDLN